MRVIMLFLLISVLPSCSLNSEAPIPERVGRYDFGYRIALGEKTRLIQVFDDGERTYLQFLDLGKLEAPQIYNNAKRLSYERRGNFALLEGTFESLVVLAAKGRSLVLKEVRRGES